MGIAAVCGGIVFHKHTQAFDLVCFIFSLRSWFHGDHHHRSVPTLGPHVQTLHTPKNVAHGHLSLSRQDVSRVKEMYM